MGKTIKIKTRQQKRRILIKTGLAVLILGLLMTLPFKPPPILTYNHTESVPVGWYLMLPVKNLKDGDIVGFDPADDIKNLAVERGWLNENDVMLKKIGALEGESYEIRTDHQFYANEKYIGQVVDYDGKQRPMPRIEQGKHSVEKDHFLPVAEHPSSFDGRYYGTIPIKNIRFRAIHLSLSSF
jgi:conjugative transfer signal peptidase TraF